MAPVRSTSISQHALTNSCCRSRTTASVSMPKPIRARPGWGNASSRRWRPSLRQPSSGTRPMTAPGSYCAFSATAVPRPRQLPRLGPRPQAEKIHQPGHSLCETIVRPAILLPMTPRDTANTEITPEVLLRAYACGIFPMAESADDPSLFWVEPEMRGVIPFDGFHISSRLARTVRSDAFTVTVDKAFKAVIAGCASPQAGRNDTWINQRIRDLYVGLYGLGHAHSVEVWQDDDLVGGLYGVNLGRAFFGESMFHRVRDASKVALVHLVARLISGGFELLDTQYVTDHLKTFGAVEIPRRRYTALLDSAIKGEPADFTRLAIERRVGGAQALD